MKKLIIFLSAIIMLTMLISLKSSATNTEFDEEYYSELIESIIDNETAERLEDIGISSFSPDELFSVSFSRIGRYFTEGLNRKIGNAASVFFELLCVLVILVSVKAFIIMDEGNSHTVIGVIAVVLICVNITDEVLGVLLSTIEAGSSFMLAFIPIYTVLISLGGTVASAVTYNTVTFTFAQIISLLINSYVTDLTGMFLALSMAFSLNSTVNMNRFIQTVNKIVSTVVGFLASGFAAVLSVRGVLSVTIDSASSKSIKYLIGNLIPIVGSSISDAYSTLLGSINVVRGSVAIAGIIIMLVIVVPPVLEGVLYCITFMVLSYISEMMELKEISNILKVFQSALRTVILLNIFMLFVLLVSTAIMITVKGGG